MPAKFSQVIHPVPGVSPVADGFDSTQYSGPVNASLFSKVVFLVYKGVGTTGTATLTVLAGSDAIAPATVPASASAGPTASTAIPFKYKAITSFLTGDTEGAMTQATASGFLTTAGSHQLYVIEVDCEELGDLTSGYKYLYVKSVEGTNSPCTVAILALGMGGRYQQDVPPTAVA
jgi:hypothetical protein